MGPILLELEELLLLPPLLLPLLVFPLVWEERLLRLLKPLLEWVWDPWVPAKFPWLLLDKDPSVPLPELGILEPEPEEVVEGDKRPWDPKLAKVEEAPEVKEMLGRRLGRLTELGGTKFP